MQLSIEKLVDSVGYLPGKRCPYPPTPHLFLLKYQNPLRSCDILKRLLRLILSALEVALV